MACAKKRGFRRDGTSQANRLLSGLRDDYIRIEERGPEQWFIFARKMSEAINYYNSRNEIDGTWTPFFEEVIEDFEQWLSVHESDQEMPAHLALFIAFLQMMEYAREDINYLTRRHLDFYFKDILGFKAKPPVADRVHVLFDLAQNAKECLLKKGSLLKAGKDALGKELLYEVEKDTVVNQAKVVSIKTVFQDKAYQSRIYAAQVANSTDGLGKDEGKENVFWPLFGEIQSAKSISERSMTEVAIGFAIASPVLKLKEGERTIRVRLKLKSFCLREANLNFLSNALNIPADIIAALKEIQDTDFVNRNDFENAINSSLGFLVNNYDPTVMDQFKSQIFDESLNPLRHLETPYLEKLFKVYASGDKEWIDLGLTGPVKLNEQEMEITTLISSRKPAIAGYNERKIGDRINTIFPVVKLLLNNESAFYFYEELSTLQVEKVHIQVDVNGARDLVLQNDQSVLEPSGNFLPFGGNPSSGASFYVGSHEIFSKKVDSLTLELEWAGLPNNMAGHYASYSPPKEYSSFLVALSVLNDRRWISLSTSTQLFSEPSNNKSVINVPLTILDGDYQLESFGALDHTITRGFLRIDLGTVDFGHAKFPNLYVEKAIQKTSNADTILPNQPYTPELKSISANYTSSHEFAPGGADRYAQFLHIEPFGTRQTVPDIPQYWLPAFYQGTLYIGLENLRPPQNINLLFQLLEGSGDPDFEITRENIEWSVLSGDQWLSVGDMEISEDSTIGFQTSGILSIGVWKEASLEHTVLPTGLYWLRATVNGNPAGISRAVSIETQAVKARFTDRQNDPAHLLKPLEPESIRKLKESVGEVKGIRQPYVSFGGIVAEQQEDFYIRISERLRHRQRSINRWDYEHLVLQAFPEVYKVKCLNHTNSLNEAAPGEVTVVVIPDLKFKNAVNPLKPRASPALRQRIWDYLLPYLSLFVGLRVENPVYEELLLDFKVGFHQSFDGGYYGKLLNDELKRFLSPWAYDEGREIIFGGRIYKSSILNFIEEQPYVDYVTNFKFFHNKAKPGISEMLITNPTDQFCIEEDLIIDPVEVEIAIASSERSILVSAPDHRITVLKQGEYACAGANVQYGIGNMIINVDLIVS